MEDDIKEIIEFAERGGQATILFTADELMALIEYFRR